MKMMTKADKILILALLLLSITSIFAVPRLLTRPSEGKQVVVTLDSQVIYRFPLENTEESKFIEVPFEFKGSEYVGRFEMKNGRVMLHRLSEEISPLSIHTDMGWISESYQMILCLPIKLLVTIEDTARETDFDLISH